MAPGPIGPFGLLTSEAGLVFESGLSMKMAAPGAWGELVASRVAGFRLAFNADALWAGTPVEGVAGGH